MTDSSPRDDREMTERRAREKRDVRTRRTRDDNEEMRKSKFKNIWQRQRQ